MNGVSEQGWLLGRAATQVRLPAGAGADQPSYGVFVWEDADDVAAAFDLGVKPLDRSIGLVEGIVARCWAGNPM
jgi:hypothetical protein